MCLRRSSESADQGNANVADPVKIDLTAPDPKAKLYDAIFVVNLFQVAPVCIADSIAQVAARVLTQDGFVAIYGPFKVEGKYTTESNEAFDKEILAPKIPEWGLKDVNDLEKVANAHSVALKKSWTSRRITSFSSSGAPERSAGEARRLSLRNRSDEAMVKPPRQCISRATKSTGDWRALAPRTSWGSGLMRAFEARFPRGEAFCMKQ
jgi:hypothetical protein